MEKKVFGYPEYDANGEMVLTTYDNEYRDMMMDIRMYKMKAGESRTFGKVGEETAILLLEGDLTFKWAEGEETVHRDGVFIDGPWTLHMCTGNQATVTAVKDAEIMVQCAENEKTFASHFYRPEDCPWREVGYGKFGDVARRKVNTIFDHDICPESNMVLGEILNERGNWCGYLPHRHPQPEVYAFRFDRPEGFGASFVGDQVFKSTDYSFSAIPGGDLHPQALAPGYQMYIIWMIRHLPGNPWLQTDRCEDEAFTWLHDAKF